MTDPQTAADAAERVPLTAAQEARAYLSTLVTPKWFGRELVRGLLAEHDKLAAELEQVRGALTVAAELLNRLAAPDPCEINSEGSRWAHEGRMGGYLAPCPHLLGRRFVEAWRTVQAEPSEPVAEPTPGKRTPEQWCAEYRIDIADPDGWRNTGDPAWDEPITLPDFLRRAAVSTTRGLTPDVWNRLSREAHEAADAERSDREGAEKGPESHGDAFSSADRPSA